jgi:hypothetical protein
MRHVIPSFQASTLRRGKSLEQFLGGLQRGETRVVKWLELRPFQNQFEVWSFEAPDVGDEEFADVYEFGVDDIESPVATFSDAADALHFAHNELSALPSRWVNVTVVGAEYADYVAAGRPSHWPPAQP